MEWKDLTLRQKIGQTVMLLTTPKNHKDEFGSIKEFLERYPIGGLFKSGELIDGKMINITDFKSVSDEYNKHSNVPLFLADDMERGTSDNGMVLLPYIMALGATDNENLAYDYGKVLANEAKSLGLNWLFTPDADLNLNHLNPVINIRSISDDYKRAAKLLNQVIKGMQDNGIASTVKHFPGCGMEELDSHLASTINDLTMEEWENTFGNLYRSLINDGAYSFMTAHVAFPAVDSTMVDDNYKICTMSEKLTSGLLKGSLNFGGVVVTDALIMGGFGGNDAVKNQVESFKAGSDVLLWPKLEYIDEVERQILSGEIPMSRLEDALSRIWSLKTKLGLFEKQNEISYDNKFALDVSRRVSEECLTLVWNKDNNIPFDKNKIKKVLVVAVTPWDEDYETICLLKPEFEKQGIQADMARDIWTDKIEAAQNEYDLILFALSRAPHRPIGPLDMYAENASSIWASHYSNNQKTVIASFGSPYIIKYYKNTDMYINAYSLSNTTMTAIVKTLFGEIEFTGTSPVKLNIN